jgi:Tfp pilus assembly protein PilE
MHTGQKDLSIIERLSVLAIILLIAAIGIQSLLHAVKESEERTLSAATVEYNAVRRMYAEPYQDGYFAVATSSVKDADNSQSEPIK